ncbi:GNAT family N-acetyltransferase [Flavivirga jejuensis]|uniref:GNAT family N-acetyltransferase n=1 Tax=Flavivirga jejuensis TaxID=870487 RepID=A0ABT8WIX3_9FLAO|nr:GNAT family N-acetyltransferase [Flavivirga jejuensis]MDO5973028.1 GNAT family N-acetyltransferase [Flavivirga jejuensis]
MNIFELKYVAINSPLYDAAVALRVKLFFKNMENSHDLIHDDLESKGIHLVCLNEKEVVGTGRLNIKNNTSIISQMAIKKAFQKKGIGLKILKELIALSKENKVSRIELNARETALPFYEKLNFKALGNKYPSKKTKIIHQKMELIIK